MDQDQSALIDEMITTLPKNEQVIVKRLRALVKECLPQSTEIYNYFVPYYRHHRLICFIWPPSIGVGTFTSKDKAQTKGVTLGFNQGYLLSNFDGALLAEGRKQVYVMYFKTPGEIDDKQIRAHLLEAALLDEDFGRRKKALKRKRKT